MTATSTVSATQRQAGAQKIAVVAPSLEILGGQGVQAGDLMRGLRKEGFQVMFVPVNPSFPRGLRWVRRIPLLRTVLNQLLYIPSLHRLRHVDAVHIFSASYWSFLLAPVPAILAARLLGKRAVLNYHSGEAQDHLSNWGARVHPWLSLVDEIVVPSGYLRKVFAEHGYEARVILNVVNTSSFSFRQRAPLRPKILSVRNLEAHYCVENTLRAFVLIKKQWPEATLTVVGYGSQEAQLKQWVKEQGLKDVTFKGRVEPEQMPAIYDSADIFINSSIVDNQPLSILEAFAAGLCVISTPTGDIPSMVKDRVSGMLVPHQDPNAIALAVNCLLTAPTFAADIATNACAEVEKYTWTHVSSEWAKLYQKGQS